MRTLLPLLFVAPVLVFSQAKTADELSAAGLKKYSDKRMMITYELSGDGEGSELMIFEKNGWQSVRQQTMIFELYGIKTIQTLYEVTDGDFIYRLNEGDSTMTTRKDFKWSQQASFKDPAGVSEAILFSMGGTHVSDSIVLNKKCQVWTFENKALQELWIWNGLVLKRKTKLGKQIIHSTATDIQTDFEHNPELYEIPSYMKVKE